MNGSPKGYFWSFRGLRQEDPLSPMLFVIIVKALHPEKVKQVQILTGFSIERSSVDVNHLQFANNTIFFCGATIIEIQSVKAILQWFELMSGLKINYDKCEMFGIRTNASLLTEMAISFGCKVGKLPIKYLGLPLCMGIPKRKIWNPVV